MGLTLKYFYSLTPRQFDNILTGYRRRCETEYRLDSERMRNIMWAVLAPHQKKNANFTPQKLIKFDWETEEAPQTDLENLKQSVLQNNVLYWQKHDGKA